MNSNPKVTFVIPAYNVEEYLSEAVESVLRQTVQEWSMIIVDDCSTDNTYDVAKKYAMTDTRITVLSTERQSGGVYEPRKKGIEHARTELVSPLDADDYIERDYLEKLLLEKEKLDVRIIYPTMYDKKGDDEFPMMDSGLCGKIYKGKDCVAMTLDGWRINCNGGLIDRSLYLAACDDFVDFVDSDSCYKDEILTRFLLWHADTVALSTAKYVYRNNTDSVLRKKSKKQFDTLINNRELLQFATERYGKNSEEHILAARQNFHGIANSMRILRDGGYTSDDIRYAQSQIRKSYEHVDWKLIWRHDSKYYWFALRGGIQAGMTGMAILDAVKPLKQKLMNRHCTE